MLENTQTAIFFTLLHVLGRADGPADLLHTPDHPGHLQRPAVSMVAVVGDEVGDGEKAGEQMGHDKVGRLAQTGVLSFQKVLAQLTPADVRAVPFQPAYRFSR